MVVRFFVVVVVVQVAPKPYNSFPLISFHFISLSHFWCESLPHVCSYTIIIIHLLPLVLIPMIIILLPFGRPFYGSTGGRIGLGNHTSPYDSTSRSLSFAIEFYSVR